MKKILLIKVFVLLFACVNYISAQISTFPYIEDFETGPGGWAANNTTLGTWALGTPSATIINSAASGTNAWVTNLMGVYNNNENSWVESPEFVFTAVPNPAIQVKIWWNAEFSWDGMVLQSSIDNGVTWQNVGAFGDPNNWYTDNTIGGNPGGQQVGWSGRNSSTNGSGGWVTAFHLLNGLGGQASVKLRFAFGSDGSVIDEGVAFDLVNIVNLSCNAPSTLNVSNVTSTSVDAGWTVNSAATSWQVQYGLQGFALGTGTNIVSGTNPTPITGLAPNTQYSYYVRNICAVGDTSLWSGPFNFQTLCATSLAGTFTIGATGTYPTFTAAVADLICGISGPVIFNVLPGSGPYNEQVEIPQIINASATNTITFNGNGETLTFSTTTSPNNYIIRLNGADHITFDNLNVVSIAATNNFVIHLTNNADSNTIKNCTVDLTSAITSTSTLNAGIVISGNLTSATGIGFSGSNNTIINNTVIGGYYGITNIGQASTSPSTNNSIDSNFVQDVYSYGIYLRNTAQSSITGNRINRPTRTNTTTFYGIYHTGGGERNVYEGNRIFDIYRSITNNTSTSYGIYHTGVDAGVGFENRVVNNMIYNINNNGTLYGIYNSSSDGVFYYHNTFSLDDATSTATGITRGFYQITTSTGIEFKNNIITINRGGTGTKHAIYLGSTLSTVTSNNNTLFLSNVTGSNGYGFFGTNFQTFANWQTANTNAYDQNSVGADPIFVGPTFGNLTPSNPTAGDFGDATLGVLTDVNGVARSATTPDPGAIEFVPPSCPQPSALGVNQQATTASLAWTENGTATTWQIEWDTLGFIQGAGNVSLTTNNPSLISGLAPQGMYTFYVRSVCAPGDSSLWAGPFTFTTLCAPFTAPYIDSVETFTPTTNSTLSNVCWSSSPSAITTQFRWDVDAFGSTPSLNTGPVGAFSGTNYFYTEANSGVTGAQAILTLPLIDASGLTVPMLEYYTHMFGANMGNLFVEVFDGTSWVKVDSLIGQQQTAETDPWTKQQIILTTFPDTLQIRFIGVRGNGTLGDMSLDNIAIKEAPTCPEPKFLNVSNVLTNQASFGWTEIGSATNWQVEWGLSGFAQGNGVRILTNNNPYTQFGLQPQVTYDFYVRSICTPGDSSLWVGPYTFTTECTIITSLPYFEDFENGRGCWIENNTTNGTWGFGTPAMTVINSAASGVNSFATGNLNGLYNASENSWVLSPRFDFTNVNNPKIEVKVWWNAEFSWDGMVLQSSIDNGASWQNVGAFGDPNNWYTDNTINGNPGGQQEGWSGRVSSSNGSNGWVLASHLLTGLNNQPSVKLRFAFGSDGSVQDDGVAFDDVHIFDVCVDPTNLTATNISSTTTNLAWTENGPATSWNIEYDTTGFTLGTGTNVVASTNPFQVTGLIPATTYDYYVLSDCGQDSSAWVGPFQFITACVINSLGADTTICSVNALSLDAGSGFSTYSWSNGSSSQIIVVDSTNFGLGIHTIYVDVTDTISGCTATDTIVVEITTCVGVKENTATIAMNVYPNPSKGQFSINLTTTNTTDLQIRITNVQGQEVFIKNNFDNINSINENINIGNVKGVYFVNIITNNEVITKKIIVQ